MELSFKLVKYNTGDNRVLTAQVIPFEGGACHDAHFDPRQCFDIKRAHVSGRGMKLLA
jgi:hypothetical protein